MKLRYWPLGLMLLAALPAAAQDDPRQTPENAKRFIEQTLSQSNYISFHPTGNLPYRITGIVPSQSSICVVATDRVYQDTGAAAGPFHWDFRKIREVNQATDSVVTQSPPLTLVVSAGSEATAARLAYAMEFLRQHCDPAADTGF